MIDTDRQNSAAISHPLPTSLLGSSAAARAETLVDDSWMIRTQMGSTVDKKIVAYLT
jgi:hypothetical protein